MSQSQHSLSSGEMSDRMEQPSCKGSSEGGVGRGEQQKSLLKVWIWHDATSILCTGALMRIVVPHPSQPHLVDPSHSEVTRSGSGLSFCQLEDEAGIVERLSQGLSQCHLQGSLEFLLCDMVWHRQTQTALVLFSLKLHGALLSYANSELWVLSCKII